MTSNKTAAIYDRWLFTLGGGEQVAFAYAECLRDLGYKTTLLTHKKIDVKKAEGKMNVDLKDIEILYLPEQATNELSAYTPHYDVFINTSYLDYFPNRSKQGILSVFFPGQIFLTPYEYIKRAFVLPSFRKLFIYPSHFEGFTYDEYKNKILYKWIDREAKIIFHKDIRTLSLTFYMENFSFGFWEETRFLINGTPVKPFKKTLLHTTNQITFSFTLPPESHNTFAIALPKQKVPEKIALVRMVIPDIRYTAYNIFKSCFPKWEMRLHGGPGVTKLSDLESYQSIITISEFCKFWIKKYWGLNSLVLYPPVNTMQFSPAKHKKNRIIHVGRFFVTGHSKKQLDMVKVFKKMLEQKPRCDWELHFVGSVQQGSMHQEYFQQVLTEAIGFPVFIHQDISFTELKKLLGEAKIYWHATGLDEDENQAPILLEHFGITTVEAMASGCVPVVINAGGQPEIVSDGKDGYIWNDRDEWIAKTWTLISDPERLQAMSQQAIARSRYFDRVEFKKRFKKLLHQSSS